MLATSGVVRPQAEPCGRPWLSKQSPSATRLRATIGKARPEPVLPPMSRLLDAAAGDAASHDTRQAVARAETRQQAVALLLMSPEFQRR